MSRDELVRRLRHLVSLNAPEKGGPYQGFAAAECMKAMTEAAAALEAALAAALSRPEQVAVKPLEWIDRGLGIRYAHSIVGTYKVNNDGYWWRDENPIEGRGGTKACEADYEQRIRSVLTTAPALSGEPTKPEADFSDWPTVAGPAWPDSPQPVADVALSPSDPVLILAGIRQFGLAPDGTDLRDLETALTHLSDLRHWREECGKVHAKLAAAESRLSEIHAPELSDVRAARAFLDKLRRSS